MRRGEKRRFTVVFSSFPLFSSSLFFSLSPSPLMVYSAALLALWLWLDLCGSGGAWCLLAVLFPLLPSCWLWLFWCFASGLDLWGGSAAGVVSASSFASASGAGASSALVLSERVQAFPCPVLRLWWGLAGRRCRPKRCSIMHNSEMAYLYDMLMAYCTKRRCFWLAIFTFCQDII